MLVLLAAVNWLGVIIFTIITVAGGGVLLSIPYGVYLLLRNFFRAVRRHGK